MLYSSEADPLIRGNHGDETPVDHLNSIEGPKQGTCMEVDMPNTPHQIEDDPKHPDALKIHGNLGYETNTPTHHFDDGAGNEALASSLMTFLTFTELQVLPLG